MLRDSRSIVIGALVLVIIVLLWFGTATTSSARVGSEQVLLQNAVAEIQKLTAEVSRLNLATKSNLGDQAATAPLVPKKQSGSQSSTARTGTPPPPPPPPKSSASSQKLPAASTPPAASAPPAIVDPSRITSFLPGEELCVIWADIPDTMLQARWLHDVLMSRIIRPIRVILSEKGKLTVPLCPDTLLVAVLAQNSFLQEISDAAKAQKVKRITIFNFGYAENHLFDRMYRMDYDTAYNGDSLVWMPVGTPISFGIPSPFQAIAPLKRTRLCAFIGAASSPQRSALGQWVSSHPKFNCFFETTGGFMDFKMRPFAFRTMLADTKIAFCPHGDDPELFRMWEALAVGAVPVIEGSVDIMSQMPQPCPFPRISNWNGDELTSFMERMADPVQYEQLAVQVHEYYMKWHNTLLDDFAAYFEEP